MNVTARFWDWIAGSYDEGTRPFAPNLNRSIEIARKYLRIDGKVLDFGCGTGTAAIELAGCVGEILAVDISSQMLDAARTKADEGHIRNIRFLQADIFDPRLKRGSYDAVLAFNILHVVGNARKAIRRIVGLLKSGGMFISMTPCLGEGKPLLSILPGLPLLLLNAFGLSPLLRFYSVAQVKRLVPGPKFRILESEILTHGHLVYFCAARKEDNS